MPGRILIEPFLKDERARALLVFTIAGLLLFCGRDTIGFAIDLMPGGKDGLAYHGSVGIGPYSVVILSQ